MIKWSLKKEFRNKNDNYLTPNSVIQQLLDIKTDIPKSSSILEPCCSPEKCIVNVLEQNGYNKVSYNIFDESNPETNFLTFDEEIKYDYIITNTPYGRCAMDFIDKMKKIATKQIITLYNLNFITGTKHYNKLWCDDSYKLKELYVFVRPCWLCDTIRLDGKYKTGINAYAWFVFEKGYKGETILKHIDNSRFVLTKNDKK